MTRIVPVELGSRSYDVVIGRGLLDQIGLHDAVFEGAGRAAIVTQPPVRNYAERVTTSLADAGLEVSIVEIEDGERAKRPELLQHLWERVARLTLTRSDLVVAVGGGVVGDLAGFAAATYHRGIRVLQVPTTLLAQVDAAIGGKTGINLPAGKNLVGAFHQPAAVVTDLDTLQTLDERVRVEGMGEVVKYGLIRDPGILDLLQQSDPWAPDVVEELVHRSVSVKAEVVGADELESGERAHLNLGHTYGHALEALTNYAQVLHGEAVAVGMLVALDAGERMGITPSGIRERTQELLERLGLPISAPRLDRDLLWQTMARDKKATDDVNFVLLEGLARPVVTPVAREAVDAAIDAVERRT